MSDMTSDFGGVEAAHCEHTPCNRVRISVGEVCATNNHIGKEEPRIWIILPRICELVAHERRVYPSRFDDRYQCITGSVVLGKVERCSDDVGDTSELERFITVAVKEGASTM